MLAVGSEVVDGLRSLVEREIVGGLRWIGRSRDYWRSTVIGLR